MKKGKTFLGEQQYTIFKYKTDRGWYPRWVQNELVDEVTARWKAEGIEYKKITQEEAGRLASELNLFT